MKITAATVVANEEVLIAKHICDLAALADEVVCVVQPSADATLMIARAVAERMFVPCRVIEQHPDKPGWEYGLETAFKEAKFDWMFMLTADESYVGSPLRNLAKLAKAKKQKAAAIGRWHAIACGNDTWFKQEGQHEVRLFHKGSVGDFQFGLHRGLNHAFNGRAIQAPPNWGRIIEAKAAWQHYRTQQFIVSQGHPLNELTQCEEKMPTRDLRIGQAMWEKVESVYESAPDQA